MTVFFYRDGVDVNESELGPFTVARVTIAPAGQWERAGDSASPLASSEIQELYFAPLSSQLARGTAAFLVSDDNESDVRICPTSEMEWAKAVRVPHGTPVVIRGSERFSTGSADVLFYEVETTTGQRGWALGSEIIKEMPDRVAVELRPANEARAVRCDRFDLKYTLEGETLRVSLDTDLPADTQFMFSVDRSYRRRGDTSSYPLSYVDQRVTVRQLRLGLAVDIPDSVFQAKLDDRLRMLRRIGEPSELASVEPRIEISAVVGGNTFGSRNENLVGAAVKQRRSGRRVVESQLSIQRPMR